VEAERTLNLKHTFAESQARRDAADKSVWRRPLINFGFVILVWTAIGFFFTFQVYFAMIRSDRPVYLSETVAIQFSYAYIWALVTPFALWLAGRYRLEQEHWRRNLLLHVVFSTACAILVGCMLYAFNSLYWGKPTGTTSALWLISRTIFLNASENYGIYSLILLARHALDYYRRYIAGERRAAQLQTQLAEAQLQALKMQLQPHFLFNTLHSISALIYKDVEAADKMIARLGDFLRLTLENSGTQEVTLQQELEFLKCYLEIERIRFQDRLTTTLRIDPQALNTQVPNLILQPIVENAIRHGIAPRSSSGQIDILAERKKDTLRICIKDNGPGLPLNRSFDSSFKGGVGLANTRARLEQLYGAAYRFELANDPRGGLVVTLEIPSDPPDPPAIK
jgi:two-component system, LytTR family, sensor kinase